MTIKIEKVVEDFVEIASAKVGDFHRENYSWITADFEGLEISSPIEQLVYLALKAVFDFNHIDSFCRSGFTNGYEIYPQHRIDNYRVDFLVSYYRIDKERKIEESRQVIVECDSQKYHERDESERRREKARDRHFTKLGLHAMHFTGKEIMKNPFQVAAEVVSYITNTDMAHMVIDGTF